MMTRSSETTSRIMGAVRNRDTGPELALRRAIHARGLRFRLRSNLMGKPDIAFGRARVVVFVDGDYWHGNVWRTRGFESFEAYYGRGDNGSFWLAKINRNVTRDLDVTQTLTGAGWTVLRVWESDLTHDLDQVADMVAATVRGDATALSGAAA